MRRWLVALVLVVSACSDGAPVDTVVTATPDTQITEPSVDASSTTGVATTPGAATGAADGASSTSEVLQAPTTRPSSTIIDSTNERVVPEGFSTVGGRVTGADGTPCEVCLWLAATTEERARGLMFATELGGPDGMAFVYPAPHTGTFWMKNTVMPLSIAFFGADGAYLDAFDMEPCTADACTRYPTPRDFTVAIETERGGLDQLGIGPGSMLELGELPCPVAR